MGTSVSWGTSVPWQWEEAENPARLDVWDLTDGELSNLARYRAVIAVNTVAGHPDHQRAIARLSAVYGEIERRQRG